MIILSLSLLKNSDYLYDVSGINRFQLNACLERIRKIYPGRVELALTKMLNFDFNERPDWNELTQILGNLKKFQPV